MIKFAAIDPWLSRNMLHLKQDVEDYIKGLYMADDDLDKDMTNDLLMQDLYKQMGVDPLDDEEQMRKKLRKKRQDTETMYVTMGDDEDTQKLKEKAMDLLNKAEAILLDTQNRQEYNNALKKQTLTINDPNDPAQSNQPADRNQYYLTPDHDLKDPMQTFEEFVDKNDGVINRVGEEMSAEDVDKLENGEPEFGMDATQQGSVKFGFPNEKSCSEFGKDLLKQNVITSMQPRPSARKEEDDEKLQNKNLKAKEEVVEEHKNTEEASSSSAKADTTQASMNPDPARRGILPTPTPQAGAADTEERESSISKPGAIPTLKPPGSGGV